LSDDSLRKASRLWGLLGGKKPETPRKSGSIWFVNNESVGIPREKARRHPVVVLSVDPVRVIVGSGSHPLDMDAVPETFSNLDLLTHPRGSGLTGATTFDVCRDLPLGSPDELVSFVGCLTSKAFQRLLDNRKQHCR
jgi:hypothetical protein